MVLDKPRLVFQAEVKRGPYFRRFAWLLLGTVTAFGAWVALQEAARRELADPLLLDVGLLVAALVLALLAIRMVINLVRGLTTRYEHLRFFDRGFTWQRGQERHKYGWNQLRSFRQGARRRSIFGATLFETGAQVLTMRDGSVFKVTRRHGDTQRFARAVRPYIADVTGISMGRALRQKKTVRLHRQLALSSAGVIAGKHKIPWSRLDIQVRGSRLIVRRRDEDSGKFKTVKRFGTHQIENLPGFLDVADSTIRNYQPERFRIKVQGMEPDEVE
jgi:hypothetical protein